MIVIEGVQVNTCASSALNNSDGLPIPLYVRAYFRFPCRNADKAERNHVTLTHMNHADHAQIVAYLNEANKAKYSEQAIKNRFEAVPAPVYGADMARWIPDFEYAHRLLIEGLAIHIPDTAIGVDLGAGTGRVSKLLLNAFPSVQLTLVDISANMLGEAKRQLAGYTDRCRFRVHDIFDEALDFPAGSLDFVVSVFAICHAQQVSTYVYLYQRIRRWLKPGGIFVCYDHVLGDSLQLNALGWHRLLLASQNSEQAKEGIVSTYQEDSPLPLRQHLDLLIQAGFGVVDVLYKRNIFAIYTGIK